MVIERQVPPFLDWLLGAHKGLGLVPVALVLACALVVAGFGLAGRAARGRLGSRIFVWLVLGSLAGVIGIVAVDTIRWLQQGAPSMRSLVFGALGGVIGAAIFEGILWQARLSAPRRSVATRLALSGILALLGFALVWRYVADLHFAGALRDAVESLVTDPGSVHIWLVVVGILAGLTLVLGLLYATLRHGPKGALFRTGRFLWAAGADLVRISPRRVWALAWLAVKESLKSRALVVFGLFVVILLFAAWFLDPGSQHPAELYITFVLSVTGFLLLLLVLFLSCLSLPAEIKSRTLHTIVTKPVRPSEIVLGRILGFSVVGTLLLVVMAAISYVFVIRGLSHRHELAGVDLENGKTSLVQNHRHDVDPQDGYTQMEHDHWHEVTPIEDAQGGVRYEVGPPQGFFAARVPVYGKLHFLDRQGRPADKGINVGNEWTYRSYIEGGSWMAAIWTLDDVTAARFPQDQYPEGLPLEFTLNIFRSWKGEIKVGVKGKISIRNPETGLTVTVRNFEAKEYKINKMTIPRTMYKTGAPRYASVEYVNLEQIPDTDKKRYVHHVVPKSRRAESYDLFEDLADSDGSMEIWLECIDSQQYFGAAQPDMYIRARDASFELNFIKGYIGIWLPMLLIVGFGVMFSTFLSAPVAMLATIGVLIAGFVPNVFLQNLASGEALGGGPIESAVRLVTQQNMISELNPGLQTTIAKMGDKVAQVFLRAIASVVPDLGQFNTSRRVAEGFDIPSNVILVHATTTLAYLLPALVVGFLFLKMREVAR